MGVIPAALKARVDTTWSALDESKRAAVIDKVAAQTLVAVTNKRIIRASPRKLVTEGHIRDSIPLGEVQFVRSRNMQNQSVRPTIDVITNTKDVSWMFPKQADTEQIDLLSQVLENGKNDSQPTSQLRLGILNLKPSVCCKVWRQILDFNQN